MLQMDLTIMQAISFRTDFVGVHCSHGARAADVERLAAALVDRVLVGVVTRDADGAVLLPPVAALVPDVVLSAIVVKHRRVFEIDLPGALLLTQYEQAALRGTRGERFQKILHPIQNLGFTSGTNFTLR